jgi:predicted esterase
MHLILVALVALFTTGCLHLVPPMGPAPLRYRDLVFDSVDTTSNVVYGSAPDQQGQTVTLRLDLYQPVGDTVASRPAIVWVHGGSFCCGTRTSPEIVDEATTFARKGYVGASISYRLTPGGCSAAGATPECVQAIRDAQHDAQTAVRFLRANATTYGIDASRIAIAGTSAGAITALNVGFNGENPGAGDHPGFSSRVKAAVSLSGARLFGPPDAGDAASLLFHGSTDRVVPYQWAVDTVNAAKAAGLTSYLTTWQGEGHTPYGAHRAEIHDQTTNLLYHVLDLANAAS